MDETRTILVVEDHQDTADLLSMVFDDASGYVIVHAPDAETALRMVVDTQPDLLLVDLWLPGMDGLQFYDALLADYPDRAIPALFLTASPQNPRLEGRGLNVLGKPFSIDVLLAKVEELSWGDGRLRAPADPAPHASVMNYES